MDKNKIIIIVIILIICGSVASYIGFNKYREINEYSENCKSKSENIQNGTCEIKCNCNCDYGYIGQLCNYKYLNNGDKFYYYNFSYYNIDSKFKEIQIKIDDSRQYNNRLFLEKINDTTTFKYKLNTTGGHIFYKYGGDSNVHWIDIGEVIPNNKDKQEVLFSKTLLQTSNDDSQQQSKFTLTCKHNDPNNTEPLFLCIDTENYFIILLSQTIIDNSPEYNKIVLSEDSFP
jgi:hypothetical protein